MKEKKEEVVNAATFTKDQILQSQKYAHSKDVVNVVLKGDQSYTLNQVDDLIQEFMKVEVK